jgi:hypothetical protein
VGNAWLIVLGSALGVLGGYFSHVWQASLDKAAWQRQRDEDRLGSVADALAYTWNLVIGFPVDGYLAGYNPDRTPEQIRATQEKWWSESVGIRRIAVLNRGLEDDVKSLVRSVNLMINVTAHAVGLMAQGRDVIDERKEAIYHRSRAEELIKAILDGLPSA